MTTSISDTSSTGEIINQYSLQNSTETEKADALGQDDFLELMLTQMKNQDPFQPADNGEFIAQMAQFSTVSGIEQMNQSLENLSTSLAGNQALEAASLLDRQVLVAGSQIALGEEGVVDGIYELSGSSQATIASIYDSSGSLVKQIQLGSQVSGQHSFSWDGTLDDGSRAPVGDYSIEVNYTGGGTTTAADTWLQKTIKSVNLPNNGAEVVINTNDGSQLNLSEIYQIL